MFNKIIYNGKSFNIFEQEGKHILRQYIKEYKKGSSNIENANISILHFGCWNYGCLEENSGLEKNILSINKYLESNTPDLFLVHGDNYYPDSMDIEDIKHKEFNRIKLESGFRDCLNRMNFPEKHIVMGNHDILDNNYTYMKSDKRVVTKKNTEKLLDEFNCPVINKQLELLKDSKNILQFPFGTLEKKINGKSIIFVFLTTDLYLLKDVVEQGETHKDYMKTIENIKCIQNIESPDSKMNTVKYIKQLTKKQNNLINKTLGNIFKRHSCYVFVGHEPLVSAKVKKGEDNLIDNEELLQLFNKSGYRNKKIIYLCADTHLYQSGIITLSEGVEIQQEIVGTGGAKLDTCPETNDNFDRYGFYNYKVAVCKKNYGFGTLEISLDSNNQITATSNFYES